jgi:FixJ family two-component response regulator
MVNLNQIVAVVDDDESICRAIKRLLRSFGIKAETFSSGEEFLGTLSSTASYRPACVILVLELANSANDVRWRANRAH